MVTPLKRRFSDSDIYCCKRARRPAVEKRVRFEDTDSDEPDIKRLKFDNTIEYFADDEESAIRLVITECIDCETEMKTEKNPEVVELFVAAKEPEYVNEQIAVVRDRKAARRIQHQWRRRARRRSDALEQLNFGLLRLT